jgi:hypothetical protein
MTSLSKADHTRKHPPLPLLRSTASAEYAVGTISRTYRAAAMSCSTNTTLRKARRSTTGWKESRECWLQCMGWSFFFVVFVLFCFVLIVLLLLTLLLVFGGGTCFFGMGVVVGG